VDLLAALDRAQLFFEAFRLIEIQVGRKTARSWPILFVARNKGLTKE
jgi:hypothetical protein